MTAILGISAYYHDSAAALVVDGRVVAAAQEERFTRRKHDPSFPNLASAYCLREAGLGPADLDYVAYYEKPLAKFERLLETYLAAAPLGFASFARAMPAWVGGKLDLRRTIRRELGLPRSTPLVFTEHHESHAASAFYPSPFEEAAVLTLDGVGEWATASQGVGRGPTLRLDRQLNFPHSLGLLYSAFTTYCGFRVNSGEYKLMGLAPYGRPVYRDLILGRLIDLRPDGGFRLDLSYFDFAHGLRMTGGRFHRLFGGPPRTPEAPIEPRHCDLAASIQAVTEEVVLRLAADLQRRTGLRRLVMAGGVALNCVANGRLLREGPFDDLWVQPAAGDAGGALGTALFVWHQLLGRRREVNADDAQAGSLLGPSFSTAEVARFLDSRGVRFEAFDDDRARDDEVARLLADGRVVGLFQGRMEYGPRALGSRSILGDPRSSSAQRTMNRKIKFRESFRPFAPSVLRERAADWFDLPSGAESPYMLVTAPVLDRRRVGARPEVPDGPTDEPDPDLCRRLAVVRSTIPAVTHVDHSARVQTVDPRRNPRFHALISAFHRRTGCPMVVNTSFNVRGEPIVGTPEDAYRCFLATDIDALVLENLVVLKSDVARDRAETQALRREHLARFAPD